MCVCVCVCEWKQAKTAGNFSRLGSLLCKIIYGGDYDHQILIFSLNSRNMVRDGKRSCPTGQGMALRRSAAFGDPRCVLKITLLGSEAGGNPSCWSPHPNLYRNVVAGGKELSASAAERISVGQTALCLERGGKQRRLTTPGSVPDGMA